MTILIPGTNSISAGDVGVNPKAALATAATLRRQAVTDISCGPAMRALDQVEVDLHDLGDPRTRPGALARLKEWASIGGNASYLLTSQQGGR